MKIIGHRGAARLATENTLPSIRKAVAAGADYIEIDIRNTKDDTVVLSHDDSLERIFGIKLKISESTLKELKDICPELPTLEEALKTMKTKCAIVELKERISPQLIINTVTSLGKENVRFASFEHSLLQSIKADYPEAFCYILEHHSPFDIIHKAKKMKMDGIGLNYGIMNHFSYFLARHYNLEIYIYTINSRLIINLMSFLYPKALICTDDPSLVKK